MCMGGSAPAPAPLPPIVQNDPEPAPILKLRKDDGTEEVVTDSADVCLVYTSDSTDETSLLGLCCACFTTNTHHSIYFSSQHTIQRT